jgi:hypothetical protein
MAPNTSRQEDSSGGAPQWQTLATWGFPAAVTGLSPEALYEIRTFARNPNDSTPTPAENSTSSSAGASSGTTASLSVPFVPAIGPIGLAILATP